jgi:glycosyltransferase involved in cell wall biosynthesis
MTPQVSIIVPNYNHAAYLPQRIDSLLAQTCQDFELILLDDCSTDASVEVLERYRGHPRVAHIVANTANSGSTFQQWDRGVALARGEYVWIAESDDWSEPTQLQAMLDGIAGDPDCVLSYCQAYFIGEGGRINWQSRHGMLSEVIDGAQWVRDYMAPTSLYNASMALWRRDCYARIPRDFIGYRFCGDWLFWAELARLGKVHVSGRLLNYYRQHATTVSAGVFRSGRSLVEELQALAHMYRRGLIGDREYARVYKLKYREFATVRARLEPEAKAQITELFRHPASPCTPVAKIRAGTWWKQLRGR